MSLPLMTTVIPEGSKGIARVEHTVVTQEAAILTMLQRNPVRPGTYARLVVDGQLMMSDTDMEKQTNWEVIRRSHGKVLIAGLGLGMILVEILQKPDVESVLVVEKYQDVIDLVAPHIASPKLTVVCADIFDWQPTKGERFDTIYFDIWADICTDNLPEIAMLHQKFKNRLNREGPCPWMGSWCAERLRAMKRRGD